MILLLIYVNQRLADGLHFPVCRYLSELLAERQKLSPFMPVLPHTYRLLNQGELLNIALFFPNDHAEEYLLSPLLSLK